MKNIKFIGSRSAITSILTEVEQASLPNLFYIGPARSGSTTFHSICSTSKNIYAPRLKETNFLTCWDRRFKGPAETAIFHSGINFSSLAEGNIQHCAVTSSLSDYLELYNGSDMYRWRVDISPSYSYYCDLFLQNLSQFVDTTVIFNPRDPVSRLLSNYKSVSERKGPETVLETYNYEEVRLARGWEFYWAIRTQSLYSGVIDRLANSGAKVMLDTYENTFFNKGISSIMQYLGEVYSSEPTRYNSTMESPFIEVLSIGDLISKRSDGGAEKYLTNHGFHYNDIREVNIKSGWENALSEKTLRNLCLPFVADLMWLRDNSEISQKIKKWPTYKVCDALKLFP